MGGEDDNGNTISSCEVYNKHSKRWSPIPSMTTKRCGCAAAVVDGKLIVVGGYDGEDFLSSCEVYNKQWKQWSSFPSMTTQRCGCAAALMDRKLFVGGERDCNLNYLSLCEVLPIEKPVSSFYTKLLEKDDHDNHSKVTEN